MTAFFTNNQNHANVTAGTFKIGKKWHDRRKIITQAFHFNILEKFAETFDRIGNILIEKLDRYGANESVEFYPISALYTLDVICGEFIYFPESQFEMSGQLC